MKITQMELASQDEIIIGYIAEEDEMYAELYHMKSPEQAEQLYEDSIQFYFKIYCNGVGMETITDAFKCYQISGKSSVCMILCERDYVIVGKGNDFRTLSRWIRKFRKEKCRCEK